MTPAENMCSLCMRTYVKFYHLKDSIRAPNDLRFEGHTNLQAVLQKILSKKGEYRKASNEICKNCRDKLHGIYAFTHQHTESEKIFHQITYVTVRLKKLKTFFILNDLKTEFENIAKTGKDVDSLQCSSTVEDIECDDSVVFKVMVKDEFVNNFEGTDFSKLSKDLSVGLLEEEYSNAADAISGEQKKIDSIGNADSEQITIEEEIIKEEWTMQEGEIFEAKAKRDILGRKQTKFSCDECNEVFATISYFSEHIRIVHENDSRDFNQADVKHNTEKEEHTQRFDTWKESACDKCDMCDAEFKYKSNLEQHKLSHTNDLVGCKYFCCNTMFTSNASLRHHRLSDICESCKCVQCDVKLSNKKSVRLHINFFHPITNDSCDDEQSHTSLILKCDHCDATHTNKEAFNRHKKIHSGMLFHCDQCDGKYKSSAGFRQHKMSHAGITFDCNQCDAKYKSSAALKRHKMFHAGMFACNQCDAKYKSSASLTDHKMSHAGTPFACNQCDAKYKSSAGLKRHKMTHAGITFACNQCDAKYKSSIALKRHKMSHAGITFDCNQCDAKYKSSDVLKRHKMAHAGITFACNKCDVSLSSKWNLKNHLQTIHSDAVFSCEHCDVTYRTKRALNTHKLCQHTS